MKNGAKFFFLSYFSNRTAKEAQKRGLGIMFLSILLSALLFLFGLIGASTLPVSFLYRNAGDLCATAEKVFTDVRMTVVDGKLVAGISEQGNQLVLNTVKSAQDEAKYSVNGFDVVVDTRPVELFDDFTAVCVTKAGKQISYEEYLALDSEVKALYTFQVKYSGEERVIDEAWKTRCEEYLDGTTDEKTVAAYAEVKKLSGQEYLKALYELYVKSYYPDLSAYETGGVAPKLRNSYTQNYRENKNILFIFDDSLIVRFTSGNGEQHLFYGFYLDMQNGAVEENFNTVHDFLLQSFASASVITVYSCILNFIMIMPYLVFISFIVMIITYCLTRVVNKEQALFGAVAKIACSFLLWTVIFTNVIMAVLSLFIAQARLSGVACIVFFAVYLLRAVLFILLEWRSRRLDGAKHEAEERAQENETEELL